MYQLLRMEYLIMATKDTERIHIKSKHLTMEDRESLYQCLQRGLNLTDSAKISSL